MRTLLILLLFSSSVGYGQNNFEKIKISKVAHSFSVTIETGQTWHYRITQDSLIIIYECTPTKSKPEKLQAKKISKEQSLNFYNVISNLRLDTLKERYDYPLPAFCDDCQSHDLVKVAIDVLPVITISQFNGRHPSVVILFKMTDLLISKKKYRIYKS